jgi:hypothetical protein
MSYNHQDNIEGIEDIEFLQGLDINVKKHRDEREDEDEDEDESEEVGNYVKQEKKKGKRDNTPKADAFVPVDVEIIEEKPEKKASADDFAVVIASDMDDFTKDPKFSSVIAKLTRINEILYTNYSYERLKKITGLYINVAREYGIEDDDEEFMLAFFIYHIIHAIGNNKYHTISDYFKAKHHLKGRFLKDYGENESTREWPSELYEKYEYSEPGNSTYQDEKITEEYNRFLNRVNYYLLRLTEIDPRRFAVAFGLKHKKPKKSLKYKKTKQPRKSKKSKKTKKSKKLRKTMKMKKYF